ncbi:hypothetical protein LCGC14_2621430, partial [marine sediment metagenome]
TEILREVLFLAPAIVLAIGGCWLAARVGPVNALLQRLLGADSPWRFAPHLNSAMAALLGLLIGVAMVWGIRILGTFCLAKEAMGMGDVHILAAIGAVGGWAVATLTFFVAPLFGVVYVLHCAAAGRGRREIPYGPWLAAGTLFVLLFFDNIVAFLIPEG